MREVILEEDVRTAAEAALSKKAEDLAVLDVTEVCSFARTLVICHGTSHRQVQTIADAVVEALRPCGRRPHHVEGRSQADWILLDYLDFVVHVFLENRRRFFALERLWGDAPRLQLGAPDETASGGASARARS